MSDWLLRDDRLLDLVIEAPGDKDWHPAENTLSAARYIAKAQAKKLVEWLGERYAAKAPDMSTIEVFISGEDWQTLKKEVEDGS